MGLFNSKDWDSMFLWQSGAQQLHYRASFYKTTKIKFKTNLSDMLQQNRLQILYLSGLRKYPETAFLHARLIALPFLLHVSPIPFFLDIVICICIITDEPLSTCSEAYAGRQTRYRWNINSEGQEPVTCKMILYVVFCMLPPGSTILAKRIGRCLLPIIPGDLLHKHLFLRNSLIYNNTCK